MIPDFLAFIFLIGGFQGIMLTIALTRIPNRPPGFAYLIALIGLVSFDLLGQLIYWQALYREWPHLLGITNFAPASFGPLFYLYVVSLLRPGAHLGYRKLWMFIPFVLCYAVNFPIYFLSGPEKIAMVDSIPELGIPTTIAIGSTIQLTSPLFVIAAMFRLWRDRHIGIRSAWLDWVLIMAVFQVLIWILVVINLVSPLRVMFNGAPYVLVSLMLYVLGYKALFATRARVAEPNAAEPQLAGDDEISKVSGEDSKKSDHPNVSSTPNNAEESAKYGNQRLDEDTMQQLWGQLRETLLKDRLYTQPNLKIADLASRSGYALHLVSQVINSTQQRNFNDVVNAMRIEEARRLLSEHPTLSVQAVMETAGFQAKSTFNTLFKSATGATPSQYRKDKTRTDT